MIRGGGMAVAPDRFRRVLRQWASGVTVVTTRRKGGIHGITVTSFCSLSLRPPLVLVCIGHGARSHRTISRQGCFAVNLLREDQRVLSDRASARRGVRAARLLGVEERTVKTGAPVLRDCLAWLDCTLVDRHEGGDHTIFVGRVEAAGAAGGRPLLWYRGDYRALPAGVGTGRRGR